MAHAQGQIGAGYNVILVGADNADHAAALSAREAGAERVLMLEKDPGELWGGDTHYGGVFHINYPGGSGLMSGAVFGRIAGASAGRAARA